jgi:Secretion system C-terminal sorting domain
LPGKLGLVTATCSTFSIANSSNSSDITSSYNNQWGWQYSSAPNGVYIDMPITTASSLSNYQFSQIPLAVPFYIRRFSIGGTGSCANPTYTSAVKVTNKPSFEDLSVCRATTSSLNIAEPNGILGIWTPSLLPYPQTTTVYSSTNFPNLATPITFTVDNGSGVCPTPITQQPTVTINVIPAIANLPALPATTSQTVCQGTSFSQLNPTSSSAAGCVIKWYLYQGGTSDPVDSSQQIPISNPALTYYPANSASGCRGPKSGVVVTVTPNITPTFTQVPAICSGASLTALPIASINGITGTWSPALNNTATTTYMFTPTTGQCATNVTMIITVNPPVTPTFATVNAICSEATLAALPTASNNAITGTWSPTLNNTATTTYTFTPTTGQCATNATMTINVNTLTAINDTFTLLSGTTASVLANDTVNGFSVTLVPVGAVPTFTSGGITLNANGTLTVLPYTTMGTYTFQYKLQSSCGMSNTATISFIVPLSPINITGSGSKVYFPGICYSGNTQTTSISLFDRIALPATIDGMNLNANNVYFTNITPPLPAGFTINPNGTITSFGGTLPFIWEGTIDICPLATPGANCITLYSSGAGIFGGIYAHLYEILKLPSGTICPNTYYTNISQGDFILDCNTGVPTPVSPGTNAIITVLDSNTDESNLSLNPNTGVILIGGTPAFLSRYILHYRLCNPNLTGNCSYGTIAVYQVNNCNDPYNKTANNAVVSNPNVLNNIELIIAPNPSTGTFNMSFLNPLVGKSEIAVFNVIGQKVYAETITNKQEHTLQLSSLPSGTYILKIANNDKIVSKKIIKN